MGLHAKNLIYDHKTMTKINHGLDGSPWSGMVGPNAQEYINGYRYHLTYTKLLGKPDIVLPKYRTVNLYMVVFGMATTTADTI